MFEVHQIPAFQDNYIYLLHDAERNRNMVIDPGDAAPVLAFLQQKGWHLHEIWLTHHHADHIGGVEELVHTFAAIVTGSAYDAHRLPHLDNVVEEGATLPFGGEEFTVWHVPGHTLGHVAYVNNRACFSGDVVFHLGCGRLFEGSPEQAWRSIERIKSLPDEAVIYSAHEYSETNYRFASHFNPENADLQERGKEIARLRAEGKPTVPTTVGLEKRLNPFFRCHERAFSLKLAGHEGAEPKEVFERMRALRNTF